LVSNGSTYAACHQAKDELSLIPQMAQWKPWIFDHKITVTEEGVAPPVEKTA
jgi:hypothetical protein